MSDKTTPIATLPEEHGQHHGQEDPNRYWFARHSKSIIFLILPASPAPAQRRCSRRQRAARL
jgi:hypothetical protein